MNKIFLKGNAGHAPRISLTQDGREIATFSLATSSSWKDETGEWQTHTDWHRIIVFRKSTVGWIKDLLQKGDTLYVEGKLTYRQKKDKYNHSRLMPYIVISDSGGKIEHIRSRKPGDLSSAVSQVHHTQEDEDRILNPSPKKHEEAFLLENQSSKFISRNEFLHAFLPRVTSLRGFPLKGFPLREFPLRERIRQL
jgi:single-strand DNA-binding protein